MLEGRKILVIGINCLLILVTIPSCSGIEEKPDLIIEKIIMWDISYHIPPSYNFYCRVKNIGDVTVEKMIFISVNVYRLVFGIFPIPCVFFRYIGLGNYDKGLKPGKSIDIKFADGMFYVPPVPTLISTYYLVIANVNPFRIIDESDFNNNYFTEKNYW